MCLKEIPIRWKITLLSYGVVIFLLLICGLVVIANMQQQEELDLRGESMSTARTVAELADIKDGLEEDEGWKIINPIVEEIRVINNTDYIVVMNMDRVRFSHPVKSMIGNVSTGSDEDPAFAEHIYFSKAKGEDGTYLRAFIPVLKDEQLNQIGVVMVGNKIPTFKEIVSGFSKEILLIVFLTLIVGFIASYILANHIKKQMFDLEPFEIKRMFEERTATFHSINEGVIAIDYHEKITIFNEKAKKIFNVSGEVTGLSIRSVLEDTRLPEIVERNEPVYNEQIMVSGKSILSTRIPINKDGQLIGAVAIFQDRTEVAKLAEELTGVRSFVEALRVQNHEHMNKLHTIAGLIQLGKPEKAFQLAFAASEEQESISLFLHEVIKDDAVAGLLISKIRRGKELDIIVTVDTNSNLDHFPPHLDHHDFVLLLGNLVENAFGAFEQLDREEKIIDISIEQDDHICSILVEDNGIGIEESNLEKIFTKGFTKGKENGTGYGLYLVKQIVDKGEGQITVTSNVNEGTSFLITFGEV
ncbi:sensor histidine kinase [Cytobacillus sp. FSL K6-0265]|uniref:sensor histidine kinase n=1 Tax=Cytobacillus sp. FSL K6-0265 TaxID=2921448 RepID=UPI0030F85874